MLTSSKTAHPSPACQLPGHPRAILCVLLAAGLSALGCSGSGDASEAEISTGSEDSDPPTNVAQSESDDEQPAGFNEAQLDYLATLDPDIAQKVLSPVSTPLVYEQTAAGDHRITFRELEYGLFKISEKGKAPLLMWKVHDADERSAVGAFELMNPGAPVPAELVALDARAEEMHAVYTELSALSDKRAPEQREVRQAAPEGATQTLGSALTVAEFSDFCHGWDDLDSILIGHAPVYEKDKIRHDDVARAIMYGASFRGTLRYQMKTRTWNSWITEEDDLEKGDVWGQIYTGWFDFDAESAIYPEGNDKGGHCLIYNP
jgi:hypothetical protein